jgi:hypothetical protein
LSGVPSPRPAAQPPPEAICLCAELIQIMENVFLDLKLDDHWDHPDNLGWRQQFLRWTGSGTFRAAWALSKDTYGVRFQHFCRTRLGL